MQVKSVEKLTNEKWLNLYAATYEHNGHTGRWLYASRKEHPHEGERVRSDAVIIVPVLRNPGEPPRLVLIKEFRIPAGGIVSGLPAGLLEPGEPIEQTVRRELREETGLEVVAIKRITPPLLSSSGMSDEAAALAFVDARGAAESKPALEDSEDIEVVLLDYEQVCRMCDQPDGWMDAKLWTVLYLYRQLGRLE
jgi:ADP-ribose pyrophosphatase